MCNILVGGRLSLYITYFLPLVQQTSDAFRLKHRTRPSEHSTAYMLYMSALILCLYAQEDMSSYYLIRSFKCNGYDNNKWNVIFFVLLRNQVTFLELCNGKARPTIKSTCISIHFPPRKYPRLRIIAKCTYFKRLGNFHLELRSSLLKQLSQFQQNLNCMIGNEQIWPECSIK